MAKEKAEVNDKAIDNRLATVEGHVKAIRKMLEGEHSCIEVVTQLLAVEKSVKRVGVMVLKNHVNNCLKTAAESGTLDKSIDELDELLEMYL